MNKVATCWNKLKGVYFGLKFRPLGQTPTYGVALRHDVLVNFGDGQSTKFAGRHTCGDSVWQTDRTKGHSALRVFAMSRTIQEKIGEQKIFERFCETAQRFCKVCMWEHKQSRKPWKHRPTFIAASFCFRAPCMQGNRTGGTATKMLSSKERKQNANAEKAAYSCLTLFTELSSEVWEADASLCIVVTTRSSRFYSTSRSIQLAPGSHHSCCGENRNQCFNVF